MPWLSTSKYPLNNVCPKCTGRPGKIIKREANQVRQPVFQGRAEDLVINTGPCTGTKCAEDSKCKNYRHLKFNSPSVQKTTQTAVLMRERCLLSSFAVRAFVYRPDPGTPWAVAALHTGRTAASKPAL